MLCESDWSFASLDSSSLVTTVCGLKRGAFGDKGGESKFEGVELPEFDGVTYLPSETIMISFIIKNQNIALAVKIML